MTRLTFFCMLTSAPLSNSIFTHSTSPAFKATFNAVHPSCNDKGMYSCGNHQCQIYILLMYIKSQYTMTYTPHSSTTLSPKRDKLFTVRNTQCSLIHHDVIHLSYPPTPPHKTSAQRIKKQSHTQFNNRHRQGLIGVLSLIPRPPSLNECECGH